MSNGNTGYVFLSSTDYNVDLDDIITDDHTRQVLDTIVNHISVSMGANKNPLIEDYVVAKSKLALDDWVFYYERWVRESKTSIGQIIEMLHKFDFYSKNKLNTSCWKDLSDNWINYIKKSNKLDQYNIYDNHEIDSIDAYNNDVYEMIDEFN
jgi:hypothetical protein